jgi:ABC-2 type transport system ATP-binding protein
MEKEALIQIDNITKKFGNHIVISNLSISIPKEGIFGIIGLSGSGKTTLLNILIGFWKPTEGNVFYNSINIQKNKHLIKQIFGFATQEGSVYPNLTVEENLRYFGKLYNIPTRELEKRISDLVKQFELQDAKYQLAKELSTGMYRRLDIACSIVHNPKVLILDEPTSNLDTILRKKVLAIIKEIQDNGTKVIITSHLLGEIEKVCDTLAILHHGKIWECGSPDQLKEKYTTYQEMKIETLKHDYEPLVPILKRSNTRNMIQKDKYLFLYTKEPEKLLLSIISYLKTTNDQLLSIEVSKPSIEEVFEAATKR